MKGKSRPGRYADVIRSNGCKDDRAGGGAKAVDDDRLTRGTQFLVSFDVVANLSASIIRNANHGMARRRACEQEHSRDDPCWKSHVARSTNVMPIRWQDDGGAA
ncbi:hypothetical protein [Bradyrhizobium sp. CCGUVB1N3]|uniref:hypothetical protein n=1 Tax=Bradyrhizobium sp. CCGUVB1N3 TaxID=2949629 RepID=UPI003531B5F6